MVGGCSFRSSSLSSGIATMSNIPHAREILQAVAFDLKRNEISQKKAASIIASTLPMLVRKPPVRRAPATKQRLTQKLIGEICVYARKNPDMQLQDIAERFDVNIGRVSEILSGDR